MNDERKTLLADFHIHTPASKCFKDEKSDDSFIEILKEAKNKNLSIIAITDHNSIEGYKKLLELKDKILDELKVLSDIKDSKQAVNKIKALQTHLSYFENLLILPGIEFEVNNGIHILCLFNPDTPILEIESFLNKGGYQSEDYGFEHANKISKWDIFQFLEESKLHDCIVIDAHTDSDKGILKTLNNGLPRAHCLSNSQLSGVCYNSEKQRSLLEETLKNSIEYQREIPLAFLKSSDAHKIVDVGKDITFLQLKNTSFLELKNAFNNPLEYISTTIPVVKNIVKKILSTGKYIPINSLEEDSLKESLCALNNSSGGFILLGVNELGGINGFLDKEINNVYNYIIECRQSLSQRIDYDLNPYPVQKGKFIIIINVKKGEKFIDVEKNGKIWVFDSKKIKSLSAEDIEKNIEKKVISQLQRKIVKRLTKIESESLEIKNSLFSFPIIQKFEKNIINIYEVIEEPKPIETLKLSKEQISNLKEYVTKRENGKSKGNIFYFKDITAPRLNNAYLRISVPKYYLKGITNYTKKHEHLLVLPGGATYYSTKRIEQFNKHKFAVIEFSSKNTNYSNKFIGSFLKSSFFLWYFNFKYDSVDFFSPRNFKKVYLPIIHIKNPKHKEAIKQIEGLFDKIIEKENSFLLIDLKVENDNYEQIIDKHNNEVEILSHEIDILIYKIVGLNSDEIQIIESSLKANNIYVSTNN